MISSLSTRIVAGVGAIAVTAVVAVAIAARQGMHAAFVQFRSGEQSHLELLAETHARLGELLDGRCCAPPVLDAALAALPAMGGFIVIAGDEVVAYAGPTFREVTVVRAGRDRSGLVLTAERRGESAAHITIGIGGNGASFRLADGRLASAHAVRLPTADDLRRISMFYGSLDRWLVAATSLIGIAVVALAWVMSRRLVRPLAELSDASQAVAQGDLSRRVPAEGADEIVRLAHSFNAMATELERQDTVRRNLVKDVAHELRTPLTALRCRLEAVLDGMPVDAIRVSRDVHEEVLHLGRLVDDLQELSLADAQALSLVISPVSVLTVAQSAIRAAGLETDRRVAVHIGADLTVRTDGIRLRQILLNLATNAARYTPAEGTITVTGTARNDEIVIEVSNTGSALTDDERSRVFDRFYRSDPARRRSTGGAGLGLAIVKMLAEALGGRVWVDSGANHVVFGVALPRG